MRSIANLVLFGWSFNPNLIKVTLRNYRQATFMSPRSPLNVLMLKVTEGAGLSRRVTKEPGPWWGTLEADLIHQPPDESSGS